MQAYGHSVVVVLLVLGANVNTKSSSEVANGGWIAAVVIMVLKLHN